MAIDRVVAAPHRDRRGARAGPVIAGVGELRRRGRRIKDFFERIYYPCEAASPAGPYARLCCGNDGAGAVRDLDRIAAGPKPRPRAARRRLPQRHVATAHPVPAGVLAECARPRRDPRRGPRRGDLLTRSADAGSVLDQPGARDLHQVEHAVEALETAVIGIGDLVGGPASGAKSRNRPRWPAYCGGRSASSARRLARSIATIQPKRSKLSTPTCRARKGVRS